MTYLTYDQWQATREWHDDLVAALPHVGDHFAEDDGPCGGYSYAFGCWIAYLGGTYWAPAGRGDMSGDLATVEKFLWDNHAKYES